MVCECIANGKWGWTPERLIALGLTQTDDGTDSPWGIDWEIQTANFKLWVDCGSVKLTRLNPESDPITVHIDTMHDFESLLDWIRD
jgi:hypothetical protein